MSNEFTRGPWHRSGCTIYALNDKKTCNRFAAQVQDAHSTRDELMSVAKMMQAAPDLLEALQQAVTSMQDSGYQNDSVVVRAALSAIAKATA